MPRLGESNSYLLTENVRIEACLLYVFSASPTHKYLRPLQEPLIKFRKGGRLMILMRASSPLMVHPTACTQLHVYEMG
jgi:hypothetical protein